MSVFATQRVEDMVKPYSRRWIGLAVLCLSLMVILMANLSISVAAEVLTVEKNLNSSQLQWIIDGYTVPYASLMLLLSLIGDKFGRRLLLNLGLLILALGALYGATLAHVPNEIIAARVAMGLGAAMIMPATLSLLVAMFPKRERPIAITIWSSTSGISMVIGPLLAGYLLKFYDWQVTFTMAIPPAIILMLLSFIFVPPSKARHYFKIDVIGGLLSVIWVAAIVYAAIEGPHNGWQPKAVLSGIIAGVGLILFIIWELICKHPLMNIRRITQRYLSGSLFAVALLFFVLFGMFFAILQLLQFVYNYDPFGTGLRLLPLIVTVTFGALLTSVLTPRIGMKLMIPIGIIIAMSGLYLTYRLNDHPEDDHYSYLVIAICLLGLSLGLCLAPATDVIMGSFEEYRLGVGGALNDTAIELGGSLGIAILGSVLSKEYTMKITDNLTKLQHKYLNPEQLAQLPPKMMHMVIAELHEFGKYIPGIENSVGIGSVIARKTAGMAPHQDLVDSITSAYISALSKMSLIGIIILGVAAVLVFVILPFGRGIAADLVTSEESPEDNSLALAEAVVTVEEGQVNHAGDDLLDITHSLSTVPDPATEFSDHSVISAEEELELYAADLLDDTFIGGVDTAAGIAPPAAGHEPVNPSSLLNPVAMSAGFITPSYQSSDSGAAIIRTTSDVSTAHLHNDADEAFEPETAAPSSLIDKFAPQFEDSSEFAAAENGLETLTEENIPPTKDTILSKESASYAPSSITPSEEVAFISPYESVGEIEPESIIDSLLTVEADAARTEQTEKELSHEIEFSHDKDYRDEDFVIPHEAALEKPFQTANLKRGLEHDEDTHDHEDTYNHIDSSERDYRDEIDFHTGKFPTTRKRDISPIIERVGSDSEAIHIAEDHELEDIDLAEHDSTEHDIEYYAQKAEEYAHDAAILEDESAQAAARANFYATKAREFAAIAALNAAKAEAQALKAEDHARKAGIAHYGAHSAKEGIAAADLIKLRLEQSQKNNHL